MFLLIQNFCDAASDHRQLLRVYAADIGFDNAFIRFIAAEVDGVFALLQRVNQIAGLHAGRDFIKFNFGAGDIAARAVHTTRAVTPLSALSCSINGVIFATICSPLSLLAVR